MSGALSRELAVALNETAVPELASVAGVARGIIARAQAAHPISAENFLRLCAAIAVMPMWRDGRFLLLHSRFASRPLSGRLSFHFAGMAARLARTRKGHNIRDGARAAGISIATLSRIEAGQIVSIESLVRIAAYVDVLVIQFVGEAATAAPVFHDKQTLKQSEPAEDFAGSS